MESNLNIIIPVTSTYLNQFCKLSLTNDDGRLYGILTDQHGQTALAIAGNQTDKKEVIKYCNHITKWNHLKFTNETRE